MMLNSVKSSRSVVSRRSAIVPRAKPPTKPSGPFKLPPAIAENGHVLFVAEQTNSTAYKFVEAAFALAIFAYFDAAFSGDWSRIGVITVEQEAALKAFAPVVVGGHGLEAALAYGIASRRGWAAKDAAIIAVKTFLAGTVCLVEAALAEDPAAAADA